MSSSPGNKEIDPLEERQEIVQDVIDRLLSNPDYKTALRALNKKYPSLKDYNRRLEKSRDENNNLPGDQAGQPAA